MVQSYSGKRALYMKKYAILTLLTLFSISCKREKEELITFQLKHTDFVEKVHVPGTVQAVNNYMVLAPRNNYGMMSVASIAEPGSFVKKGDTICVLASANLTTMYESLVTSVENTEAELKKLIADNAMNFASLKAQLEDAGARLLISSLDSVQMKFAPPVKQKLLNLEMQKTMIEKRKLEKKLASQKIIDDSEIRQMKSRIMQQQMQLQMMKDQLTSLTIISSRDGLVMHAESPILMMMSSTGTSTMGGKIAKGSNVFSNMALLQFPDLSRMQISAEVAEAEYKRIEKGQKAFISIDAIKDLYTTGPVLRKTLAGKPGREQSASKIKTYEVIISLDSCHLKMKPGLSASCVITINEVKDTIVVPTLSIFERDSLKVVYVLEGKNFIPVPVEPGRSNSSHTLITKGLKGDEIIALSEPPHNMIRNIKKTEREAPVENGKEITSIR